MLNKNLLTIRNAAFVVLFIALAVVADHVVVAKLWGNPGQTFTLFQILGPLPGFFLGPVLGIAAVLVSELINFILLHKTADPITLLRLLPMLGGAYYFAMHGKKHTILIPILAIILFNLHPVGAQAWMYSLIWLIPIVTTLFFKHGLFFKALGATFTTHAIGGSFWNYYNYMTPEMWTALIPVTLTERVLFAAGITVSFIAINAVLTRFFSNAKIEVLNLEKGISVF